MKRQGSESEQTNIYSTFEEKINLKKWDEDETEIRNFLKKLSSDLEQSFIQTRLERGVKEDEVQVQYEFELAVKEILNKEQQIKLSLELAYVLLDKMHEQRNIFYDEIDDFQEIKENLQREIDFKEQYIEEYQRRLQFLTEQNSDLNKEYTELGVFTEKLKARNSELDQELLKSMQHIETVKQNKEQDTNSKLTIIQNELENLKTYNTQLSKDLTESKKRAQQEIMQQQECLNQIDELKRFNCCKKLFSFRILQKETESLKRQSLEANYKLQGIQEEKDRLEIQLIQFQLVPQSQGFHKDFKQSDIVENDSFVAQEQANYNNVTEAGILLSIFD